MRLKFDTLSFWLGFIVASIFWGMLNALKPAIKEWQSKRRRQREERRQQGLSNLEDGLREAILRQTQAMHLAGTLFALDEVVVPPALIAPPVQPQPASGEEAEQQEGILAAWDDITSYVLPYMPDWPEMAALYRAPRLSLAAALAKGADIAVVGPPGSGKTTALAWFAAQTARQTPAGFDGGIAFLLHAADVLALPEEAEDLLQPVRETLTPHASGRYRSRLGELITTVFQQQRALLLLDGLDELPPEGVNRAIRYLAAIRQAYPGTRMIAAASFHHIDGLLAGGFAPLALHPWNTEERRAFLGRWRSLWESYVLAESWAQELPPSVDSALLNAWLQEHDDWLSPLELTLRTWALYAGDLRGGSPADAIYTHLLRLLPEKVPFQAIETLGLQAVLNQATVFTLRDTKSWLKTFEEAIANAESEEEEALEGQDAVVKPSRSLVDRLLETGLLVRHPNGQIRFSHPLFAFYLAGRAAARLNVTDALLSQPEWQGKHTTLRYLAAYGNAESVAAAFLAQEEDILQRPLLAVARWLRDAPEKAPWRGKVLVALARQMAQKHHPRALRGRMVSAAALSHTPGVQQLFLKQLSQADADLISLSLLGLGLLGARQAVPQISELLEHPSPNVYRAAALSLVAIGNDEALNALAAALVNGHDDLRQAVAEALANHPRDGHPTLQEAAQRDEPGDAPLRRAAVYGLVRVQQGWAQALLDELQFDQEWVVRNAAVAIREGRAADNPHIPQPLRPPVETPWLLVFAARQGSGVSPRQDATPLVLQALQYGEAAEKLAAVTYLQHHPSEGVVARLYDAVHSDDESLREAAYTAIFWIAASGFPLPPPQKYGLK